MPRWCDHTIHDFFLQHDVDIANGFDLIEQMKENRCRDVVRQITHHAQIRTERSKIKDQRIPRVNRHLFTRVFLFQPHNEISIQLDHMQMSRTFEQGLRQRAQPWTNFNHAFTRARIHCIHNAMNDALINQEVLTKAFAGLMASFLRELAVRPVHCVCFLASCAASVTAA